MGMAATAASHSGSTTSHQKEEQYDNPQNNEPSLHMSSSFVNFTLLRLIHHPDPIISFLEDPLCEFLEAILLIKTKWSKGQRRIKA
jgi:hypothetical protein